MNAGQAVFSVSLINILYILLTIMGFTSFISDERINNRLIYFGAFVVCFFGLNIVFDAFHIGFLNINFFASNFNNPFLKGTILAAYNPFTILFSLWVVLSTLTFPAIISRIGSVMTSFLPEIIFTGLNI
jgi:threonine/homoserine/homoserine lactone efflux protein